jgi:hypothetical protein
VSQYPPIAAGGIGDSDFLSALVPDYKWKTAATNRASTTTFSDDPDLTTTLAANGTFLVEMFLNVGSTLAADFKTMWTVPSGATGTRRAIGPGSTASDSGADNISGRFGVHAFSTSVAYSGVRDSVSNLFAVIEIGVVFTSSAGTCALQWAQVASTAVNTNVGAGSLMRVKRIA